MSQQHNRNYIDLLKKRQYIFLFHSQPYFVEVNPLFPVKLFLMSLI